MSKRPRPPRKPVGFPVAGARGRSAVAFGPVTGFRES